MENGFHELLIHLALMSICLSSP